MEMNTTVTPREALAGLPLLYVHLHLERERRPQGLNNETAGELKHSTGYNEGSAPIRDKITSMIERVDEELYTIAMFLRQQLGISGEPPSTITVDARCYWLSVFMPELEVTDTGRVCLALIVTLYADVRRTLGIEKYVQLMVAPCPECDHRALVRSLEAPVITCEVCKHPLPEPAYEEHAATYRNGVI